MKNKIPMVNERQAGAVSSPSGFIFARATPGASADPRGATMLVALVFIMAGTIVITAWAHLLGARLQQTERLSVAVQRHVSWGNTKAINQQYALTWAMRDNVTRTASTATLNGWGGQDADAFSALSAFRSTLRPVNTTTISFPFNNIVSLPTSDAGVYFSRITADSDGSQTEHLTFYNYLKSYPSTLLGDLLVIHKKPSAASGTYSLTDNLQVDGRVVIWDATASTASIRAQFCLNMVKDGTNTVGSRASTPVAILPQNFPCRVTTTAGYGGSAVPTAVTDGTLNLINNTDFTAGSVRHRMEAAGSKTWLTCSTGSTSTTNINTTSNSGTSTSDTQVKLEKDPVYDPPTTSPYGYSKSGDLNVLYVRLKNSTLKHLRISSGVEQVVLNGQTTAADYTTAGTLPPVIIWLEQADCRDIRFVGENNRPLILATGKGAGATLFCGFHGNSIIGGSSVRWRIQWINEFRSLYFNPATGLGITVTGGLRTDWAVNCTDGSSTVRLTLQRDSNPGALETLLPRDGWLEPYFLVR